MRSYAVRITAGQQLSKDDDVQFPWTHDAATQIIMLENVTAPRIETRLEMPDISAHLCE